MTDILQALKQRYHFEAWRERRTMEENLFVWRINVTGDEIRNWQPIRIRALPATGDNITDGPADDFAAEARPMRRHSTIIRSLWQPRADVSEPVLSLDTYECRSQAEAREVTVWLLGEFESGLMTWLPKCTTGDVAFTGNYHHVFLFTRANVVTLLRNATMNAVSLTEPAQQYDNFLISRPETAELMDDDSSSAMPTRSFDQVSNLRLSTGALEGAAMVKFFSTTGEMHEEDGEVVYQPQVEGEQAIDAFTSSPDGRRSTRVTFAF